MNPRWEAGACRSKGGSAASGFGRGAERISAEAACVRTRRSIAVGSASG